MITFDWNWFFSSTSQSAAAIVGIFGAFVITKILSNQAAFSEKCKRMQELISEGKKLKDVSDLLSFEWYHKHIFAREHHDLNELLEANNNELEEKLYEKLRLSPYILRAEAIDWITEQKVNREQRLAKERAERSGFFSVVSKPSFLVPSVPTIPMSKERDEMDRVYTECVHHVRVTSDFLHSVSTNPESSKGITAILILILMLFFVGVIYPLTFMPVPSDGNFSLLPNDFVAFISSVRGVILTIISAIFTGMILMFFYINLSLKYPHESLWRLETFTNLSKYSKYFGNKQDNQMHHIKKLLNVD